MSQGNTMDVTGGSQTTQAAWHRGHTIFGTGGTGWIGGHSETQAGLTSLTSINHMVTWYAHIASTPDFVSASGFGS